jgi:hypothetical protein
MAHQQAKNQSEEEKLHGDKLENAIPAPENGGHAKSAAAHLNEHSHLHNNNNPNLDNSQHHTISNTLREPPQQISRVGKGHRGE